MANLIVHGGTPLIGRITPSANKNAVLPILCATLLTREPVRLVGIPEITDVRKILDIFRMLGSTVAVDYTSGVLDVHHQHTHFDPATHHLPEEMRSRPSCWCRRCWRDLAWRALKTTCRAAPWACARSTRTWR
jgi:UDP-N-acetylglucosamine 1-carboxyvinyltransferase